MPEEAIVSKPLFRGFLFSLACGKRVEEAGFRTWGERLVNVHEKELIKFSRNLRSSSV